MMKDLYNLKESLCLQIYVLNGKLMTVQLDIIVIYVFDNRSYEPYVDMKHFKMKLKYFS